MFVAASPLAAAPLASTPLGGGAPPPSVSPSSVTIGIGNTTTITASDFTGGTVTWSSDNTAAATVNASSGVVTGIAHHQSSDQTATITATGVSVPAETASCVVTVTKVDVSMSPTTATIALSTTQQLTSTVTGGTPTTKTWTVQSGGGSVDSSGLYTAPGSATVAVVRSTSTADTSRYNEATITVEDVRTLISSAPYGAAYTGDLTIGYTVYADDGSESQAFSQVGVTEISGTGIWVAPISVPIQFSGAVVWSVPDSSGLDPYVMEVEPFNQVTGSRGIVAIAPYGVAYTGLSIGYTMYSDDGSEFQAHTTSGVAEIGSTGIYIVSGTAAITLDVLIVWDSPMGLDPFVREINPIPAAATGGGANRAALPSGLSALG